MISRFFILLVIVTNIISCRSKQEDNVERCLTEYLNALYKDLDTIVLKERSSKRYFNSNKHLYKLMLEEHNFNEIFSNKEIGLPENLNHYLEKTKVNYSIENIIFLSDDLVKVRVKYLGLSDTPILQEEYLIKVRLGDWKIDSTVVR